MGREEEMRATIRKDFRLVRFIVENERRKDAYVMNEVRASACSVSALSATSR
jgi:hypothetical protein